MILNHNKIAIFGFPRSGTKLIAGILVSFGYRNYGEWFDTWTSSIINGECERKSPQTQKKINELWQKNWSLANTFHVKELVSRLNNWNPIEPKWTVTIWQENISSLPFILQKLNECLWICARRDPWDQLLSRLIVYYNKNPDGDYPSSSVTIDKNVLEMFYWKLQSINTMQDWLIDQNHAIDIDFDELISGSSQKFGCNYKIVTADQHANLQEFVSNIEQVTDWYEQLKNIKHRPTGIDML